MTHKKHNRFEDLILDKEELAIEASILKGEYVSAPDFEDTKMLVEEAARRYVHLNTTKPVTLRLKQTDVIKIKAKAKRSNIPYQTLLSALVHDFAEGNRELTIK